MTPTTRSSVLSMLHARASVRPHDTALTFTDYDRDPAGVRTSLTWSQLSQHTSALAGEIARHGRPGDRALVLAPQGLDYVLAFLGAMQAGLVAVPLPLPHRGANHDRVTAVIADTAPTVVLTTSAAAADVGDYVTESAPAADTTLLAVDTLDFDTASHAPPPNAEPAIAYLQYSSGSTRTPTGVMLSHRNLTANFEQLMRSFFRGAPIPPDATLVSWLPFYHDMGLVLGVCAPILSGLRAELSSPVAFLERPARWVRALAENPHAWSSAPNFAFELAARKTTDEDLAGLDLTGVVGIISGAERVQPATLHRFVDRFAHFGFRDHMIRPSYGLAEATVFVATGTWDESAPAVDFDAAELRAGRVVPRLRVAGTAAGTTTALVRYGVPSSPSVRIVDPDTGRPSEPGRVGEIWVYGENIAAGYWGKAPQEQQGFGAVLTDGAPAGPWLRTGDLGFLHDGELFIVGRIKDLLIIRGSNHYPEDIEATVHEITRSRVAAISVPVKSTEQLVTVIEVKPRADGGAVEWLEEIRSDVTSAIAHAHGLNAGDVVLVPPGSIPTTTSGKIRRAACVELYRQDRFERLDA